MAHRLRPVGLDFVETAPLRLVFAKEIASSPDAVYRALAEDVAGWSEWFSAVKLARPTEDGAGRRVLLKGGTHFEESVLAAEPSELYTYRVDRTNAPGARALVEEWRLTRAGTGTRLRWTWAADGTPPFRFAVKLGRAGLGSAFRDAVTRLDRRLSSTHAP